MYGSVCVRGWVVKEGILSSASDCLDLPLSILVRRPREPARPEEKTKDVGQTGMRLRSRESEIQT